MVEIVENKKFVILPTRVIRCLRKINVTCLQDLHGYPENKILSINNMGKKSIAKLKEGMKEHGFFLGESEEPKKAQFDAFPIYNNGEINDEQ